jgi:effector-binding domain-containing protein
MLLINRLKRYRFSLEEIAVMLKDDSSETMFSMMESKVVELSAEQSQLESFLRDLRLDMDKLERGVNIMSYIDKTEIKLVERGAENILYSRQLMGVMDYERYFGELFNKAGKGRYSISGVPMAIYHDKEFSHESNDTELAVPVKEVTDATRTLDGGLCIMAVHKGAYSGLSGTYAKISEWADENGYLFCAPVYERFVVIMDKNTPEEALVTEVYCPVTKR